MSEEYLKSVAGLESVDPEIALASAVWLIENPEQIQDQSAYMKACDLLYAAATEIVFTQRWHTVRNPGRSTKGVREAY